MSLHDEALDDRSPPFHPFEEMFAFPVPPFSGIRIFFPVNNIFRKVPDTDSCVFFEKPFRKIAEIGRDPVIPHPVENDSVHIHVFPGEFSEYVKLVLLHLRISRIQHAVIVGLDLRNRYQFPFVIHYGLPLRMLLIYNTAVVPVMSSGKNIQGRIHLDSDPMSVFYEI